MHQVKKRGSMTGRKSKVNQTMQSKEASKSNRVQKDALRQQEIRPVQETKSQ